VKYMLLVHHDEEAFRKRPDAERQQMIHESVKLAQQLHASGHYLGAAPLHPTSETTCVRVRGGKLHGVDVGPEWVARTIDEYPILAIAGSLAEGTTVFSDVKELRYKESDRIAAMTEGLRNLGVQVDEREDGMTIHGAGRVLKGGMIRSFADHRVAMSFAIAGLLSEHGVSIDDPRCADISFPTFFELLEKICLH